MDSETQMSKPDITVLATDTEVLSIIVTVCQTFQTSLNDLIYFTEEILVHT